MGALLVTVSWGHGGGGVSQMVKEAASCSPCLNLHCISQAGKRPVWNNDIKIMCFFKLGLLTYPHIMLESSSACNYIIFYDICPVFYNIILLTVN